MPKKESVFISSTFSDLKEHRRVVWDALEGFAVHVRGMEEFGARSERALETCLAEVEQSDIYVGIIGFRFGSLDDASGKSFTQLEYERALDRGKEILIYLIDEENAVFTRQDIDLDPVRAERLKSFKETLKARHTVDFFRSPEDLDEKITRAFETRLARREGVAEGEDPFEESKLTLSRFLVLPAQLSGREIRVLAKRDGGEPFAVAKPLCEAFQLPYGATVAVPARILRPESATSKFHHVFAGGKRAEELLSAIHEEPRDLLVRVRFSPHTVPTERAEFFGSERVVPNPSVFPGGVIRADSIGIGALSAFTREYVAPEGKIILEFSNLPE